MAKILISHFTPIFENNEHQSVCFYDGLVDSLIQEGNDVLHILSNEFLSVPWNGFNTLKDNIDAQALVRKVSEFKPDLCIAFNNSIPQVITDALSCPILLWHADVFNFFNDREAILKNIERFHFACPYEDTANFLKTKHGIAERQIVNIKPATAIQKDPSVVQNKNISFIGSAFYSGYTLMQALPHYEKSKVREIANQMLHDPEADYNSVATNWGCPDLPSKVSSIEITSLQSSEKRISILNELAYLGLELYGGDEWEKLGVHFPWILMSYNREKVYSLKHNQNIYNSSKICVNISHSQAKVGFPWRVMDIMASNGCLLTDPNLGIEKFTQGYVKIPTFDSAAQAKHQAIKLLKDDSYRRDIVNGCHALIAAQGLWTHRFSDLEKIFNIKLNSLSKTAGVQRILRARDFLQKNNFGEERSSKYNLKVRLIGKAIRILEAMK